MTNGVPVDASLCPVCSFSEHSPFHTQCASLTDELTLMKSPTVHIFCVSLPLSMVCAVTECVHSPSFRFILSCEHVSYFSVVFCWAPGQLQLLAVVDQGPVKICSN